MSYPWGENIWDHPNPIGLSHSSTGVLKNCPRKFEFYKFYDHVKREDDSIAGNIGNVMHHAYQEYLITKDFDKACSRLLKEYPAAENGALDDERSLEACYSTLKEVCQNTGAVLEYELANISCIDGVTRPAIEVEFEIWIDGPMCLGRPFMYRGFIDAIFFNVFSGRYHVVDLKTTTWKKKHLVAEYTFNGQCLPYGIIIQSIMDQNIHSFEIMYVHALINLLEPKITVLPFQKGENDVQDWATNLYFKIKEIMEYTARDYFPRTEHGCTAFGNKACQFLANCHLRDKKVLQELFVSSGETPARERERNPWVRFVLPMQIEGA